MVRSWWKRLFPQRAQKANEARTPSRTRRRNLAVEALEERVLLTSSPALPHDSHDHDHDHAAAVTVVSDSGVSQPQGQVFFLDVDGASGVEYDGPVRVRGLDVPAFQAPAALAGQEQTVIRQALELLNGAFAGKATFTDQQPAVGDYSTVYVGGDGSAFQSYGFFLGLAEKIDAENQDPRDEALVFSELLDKSGTAGQYAARLAALVGHEAAHLLGAEHDHHEHETGPLDAVAWKVQTHIEIARDVRDDLIDDGKVTLLGRAYDVHPKIVDAVRRFPAYYYAGTVGPDAFPDIIYGQGVIHPVDTGTWLMRVLDMAWAAQTDPAYSPVERSQILAWSYGFLTHPAGDVWAHNLVNEFAEGIFPSFTTLLTEDRNFANAARHFLLEAYIEDAQPGGDGNPERSILADGDVSDDSTPGTVYAAPVRFIYETLIKPFAGQPSDSRGPLLNGVFELRDGIAALAASTGPRPAENFHDFIRTLFDQFTAGTLPTAAQVDTLYRAYLYNWSDDIDNAIRNWSELGLAIANGLTNAQSRRDLQNDEGEAFGSEANVARADAEGDVTAVDALLAELEDPNGDGRTNDSFVNQYLLPMFGVPREFTTLRVVLNDVAELLESEVLGPLRLAVNPIAEQLEKIEEIAIDFVKKVIRDRLGFDVDAFEFLTELGSKLDIKTLNLGGKQIPMYKPDDHERIDAIMGIVGIENSAPLSEEVEGLPFATFHEGATERLNDNVEFDKEKFAAYANSVTLGKLLLLMERPVDGQSVGAGQLSRLFSDATGRAYDFGKLNLNGNHGGNLFTATLPKPGAEVERTGEDGTVERVESDKRPWLLSIDTDHGWRQDSQTRTTENYRYAPAGSGDNRASWVFEVQRGRYKVQASWLAHVGLSPATNATYEIFDGDRSLGTVVVNQELFADEVKDRVGEQELFFDSLGEFVIESGQFRIELSDDANGDVLVGPVRIEPAGGGEAVIVGPRRDAVSGEVIQDERGYFERGDGWVDLKYTTATGNFPLWESELLRPVFRQLFRDWQNGAENFPDLGDATSPDPNNDASIRNSPLPALVSAFEPVVAAALPTGTDLVISGNEVRNIVGDFVLGSVTGDGDAALDSITLRVTGSVLLTENIGGRGLSNIVIEATEGIQIAPGVVVTSRQFVAGGNALTAASTGNSGNITLASATIEVGAGSGILAHATGGFLAGDVTLTATEATAFDWFFGIEGFAVNQSEATIDLGAAVAITGDDVTVTATATTTKTANLTTDLTPGAEAELAQEIDESDVVPFATTAAAVFAEAEAAVTLGDGVSITASGAVALHATASSTAAILTRGRYLGATYGSSNPTAEVIVHHGTVITAGGRFDMQARVNNTLDVTTVVPSAGEIANVSFSYGKARSESRADLNAGATVNAAEVNVLAENLNSFHNRALAAGFNDATAGIGATVVLGSYQSTADAHVAANITATGAMAVNARSINSRNETRGFASVVGAAGSSTQLQEVADFLADIDLSQVVDGETIDPAPGSGPDIGLAGAVVIVSSDNKAAAVLDDGAVIATGGDLTVNAQAVDPYQASATGSAGDAALGSVGGAVAVSKIGNQATSFVGYHGIVDVGGTLHLTADADVTGPATAFDPALSLADTDTATGIGRVVEEYADGEAAGAAVSAALAPLAAHLSAIGQNANSYVHAGGTVNSGGTGLAAGVNVLDITNAGIVGIAKHARVNQRLATLPATGDVILDASGSVESISLTGQRSSINFGGTVAANNAAGGFFNGTFVNNTVQAYIDDLATVSSGRDVVLNADAVNDVLTAGRAGSSADGVAVDGAINFVQVSSTSEAFVEDRAVVEAGRDLKADADNDTRIVNVAGGVAEGGSGGVGASSAFTLVDQTTHAFIGDSEQGMGPLGTGGDVGSIRAGGALSLTATSNEEVWTVSTSGASAAGTTGGRGGEQEHEGLRFGFGVSGDVALNSVHNDTQTFIRDVPEVNAGGAVILDADDTTQLVAGAGAITFGNHFGIGGSFARNGLERETRSFIQDASVTGASLSATATTGDQIVTLADGGSGTSGGVSVAGSVTMNVIDNVTEAAVGARSSVDVSGTVTVQADDATQLVSVAGATSATTHGFLAVGAALDLGFVNKQVDAFVAPGSSVDAGGNVRVVSATNDSLLSVAASLAAASGSGEPNRVYRQGTTASNPYNLAPVNIPGENTLTTSMALGDVDGDTDLDLITGNFSQTNRLYLNNGNGTFAAGESLGADVRAQLKGLRTGATLESNTLIPHLTMSVQLADLNGDDALDVVAGNLGTANLVYINDGEGTFLPGVPIGNLDLVVTINPGVTTNNRSVHDLIADLETAVDAALANAGLNADEVKVELSGRNFIIFTSSARFMVELPAETALGFARRDGVLLAPLTVNLVYDGKDLSVTVDAAATQDNKGTHDLAADFQAALNAGLEASGFGIPGDVRAQDVGGQVVFALGQHTLGDTGVATGIIESARVGNRIITSPLGSLLVFRLPYDGSDLEVSLNPTATNDNSTPAQLVADIQAAVDAALTGTRRGVRGAIVVGLDAGGRITFALPTHTLDAGNASELIAAARHDGLLAQGEPFTFTLNLYDLALTRSIAVADLDGDDDMDIVAGNLNQRNRVYFNDGSGRFSVGIDISPDIGLTTAVALGDIDGDDDADLIAGNVNIDVAALLQQGLINAGDFLADTSVAIAGLLQNTAVELLDLLEAELLSRFDFNALADVSIADIVNAGLANLEELVRAGLLVLDSFFDVSIDADTILNSGIVQQAELIAAGIIDALGNVSLHDLVNSGLVFLEEVLGVNLAGLSDLNISDLNLGQLLETGVATIKEFVQNLLIDAGELIRDRLDLNKLLASGIVKLEELIGVELIDEENLDIANLSPQTLLAGLKKGGPTRVYRNDGTGHFGPGVDLTTDHGVTLSVALGDVDGDDDLDVILGNSGTRSRLYLNNGFGTFSVGQNATNDANLTQQVLLHDADNDGDLDLFAANLGQRNRLYLNNGTGTFAAGINIGTQTDATTSLAVADLNNDGRADVVAGNAKPNVGVAGSASFVAVTHAVSASVGDGATVVTPHTLVVDADDALELASIVGAAASGDTAGVGLSGGRTTITRDVQATIGDADVSAKGLLFSGTARGVLVEATAADDLLSYAAGQATAGDLGVAASAVANAMSSSVVAAIADGAAVNAGNAGASSEQDVTVRARHTTDALSVAGSFAGATRLGVGAAFDLEQLDKTVEARIGAGVVNARDDVVVDASARDAVTSVVAGTTAAGEISIAGSMSLLEMNYTTRATLAGHVDAGGNVIVVADSDAAVTVNAGADSFGGGSGAGASASGLIRTDVVEASIAAGASVVARSQGGTTSVRNGSETAAGSDLFRSVLGVWVGATSDEIINRVAAGGQNAGKLGLAGSALFSTLVETTDAIIASGASINILPPGDTSVGADQDVHVLAVSRTDLLGQAGATTNGALIGIGAGAEFAAITKTTEAKLGGNVRANRDVEVQAFSDEDFASFAATEGLAFVTSFGGAGEAFALDATTRASVADDATVRATGSVNVAADDATEVDIVAGSAAAAIAAAAGASVGGVLIEKTTEAFVGDGADVTALGQRLGIQHNTGDFTVQFVADSAPAGEVGIPGVIGTILSLLGIVFDNPLRDALGDAFPELLETGIGRAAVDALDITAVGAPPADPSLSQKRIATPGTATGSGVFVTATARDDIEAIVVGLGAGALAAPRVSAVGTIIANRTSAYVDDNALINQNNTGADLDQSVIVAAGSDLHVMGIAGVGTASGIASVGPAGSLTLLDSITEAFIGELAVVNARNHIEVRADAAEDLLLVAAGASAAGNPITGSIALAGSFPVVSLNAQTHAFIDEAAHVRAEGSVGVSASDRTDTDLIGGAATLDLGSGFGTSAALTLIDKDTKAWIGQAAHVDGLALRGLGLSGYGDEITATGPEVEGFLGVGIKAFSSEDVFSAVASGAAQTGLAGIAGAVVVSLLDSDTEAFIDANARVNTNDAGAAAIQTVNVAAVNDAKVFGVAVNLIAGAVAFAGGVDLGIVRNDIAATIRNGAEVEARQDVTVSALSRKEADSFVAGLGGTAGIGMVASISLYGLRADLDESVFGSRVADFLNATATAGNVQGYIDNQLFQLTSAGGGWFGGLIGSLSDAVGPAASTAADVIADAVSVRRPVSAVSNAVNSSVVGDGNKASIQGATVTAGRDVCVAAEEELHSALDTSFTFNFAIGNNALLNLTDSRGILTTGGNAVASIEGSAVTAARDVNIHSLVEDTQVIAGVTAINSNASKSLAFVDNSTVTATAGDANIRANTISNAAYTAILPGFSTSSSKSAENRTRNTTDAHVSGGSAITAGSDVRVLADDEATIDVIANATALTSKGTFGFLARGRAKSVNDVANTVTAYIDNSDATATGGSVELEAIATPTITSIAVGVVVSGDNTLAANTSKNTIAGTVDAHISGANTDVSAFRSTSVRAEQLADIASIAGGGSGAFAFGALGAADSRNDITTAITARVDAADVTGASLSVRANGGGEILSVAVGAAGAQTFAGGGSVALNTIARTIEGHVGTDAGITTSSLQVRADDTATIKTIAGGAAGSGTVAVGASFATNDIADTVKAMIDGGSDVTTGDGILIQATLAGTVEALAAGAAGTGTVGATGGISLNHIHGTLDVHVGGGAIVTAGDDVTLLAQDTSTIRSLAGQVNGAGAASLGAAAAYNDLAATVKAYVDNADVTSTGGNVFVTARSNATIENLTAGGNFGTAAIGGSVAINLIAGTVEAYLKDADVSADGSVSLLAETNGAITVFAGQIAGGAFALNGTVTVNTVENQTRAYVDDSEVTTGHNAATVNVRRWDTGSEAEQAARGLAVVATSEESVFVRSFTGNINASVGISGDVIVTKVADTTEAFIRASDVNSATDNGEAVIVRAHQDTDVDTISGKAAIGSGDVGAGVNTTFIRNTTSSFIDNDPGSSGVGDVSTVHARGVEVTSFTRENVEILVAGLGVAAVTISGAVAVIDIDSTNTARIENADVYSQGNITVQADDTAILTADAGVGGLGAVGAGGSLLVTSIENTTRATVLGAYLNATGATDVIADSDSTLTTRVGTLEAGVTVGLAGAVSVNTIATTTEATVGTSFDFGNHLSPPTPLRDAKINQDPAYQSGGSANPSVTQSLRVEANDNSTLTAKAGAIGVGLVGGLGASIDVSAIRNRTAATIDTNTDVNTLGTLTVAAIADHDINSTTAAFSGGLAGALSGAVSVVSLGGRPDSRAATEFDRQDNDAPASRNTLREQITSDLQLNDVTLNTTNDPAAQRDVASRASAKVNGLGTPGIGDALSTTQDVSDRVTLARIANAADSTSGVDVVAGGHISVEATHTYDVDAAAGQLGGALGASVGASVAAVQVNNLVAAEVGDFAELTSGGTVTVSASDRQVSGTSTANVLGGNLGLFAASGAVANLVADTDTDARIGQNAAVHGADSVLVEADHKAVVDTQARGFTGGAAAFGGVFATAVILGDVNAHLDGSARIGDTAEVGSLTVRAESDSDADAFARGGQGGVVSGNFSNASANVHPNVEAFIAAAADVDVTGDVTVRASFVGDSDADIDSINVGGAAIGSSPASATLAPNLTAHVDAATITAGDSVTVEAVGDGAQVRATSDASGGAIFSSTGPQGTATADIDAEAYLGAGSNVTAGGVVAVRSVADNWATALANGLSLGAAGVGRTVATATADGTTTAHSDGTVNAVDLIVDALGYSRSDADTVGAGGGILFGAISGNASALARPTVEAALGAGAVVNLDGNLTVRADAMTDADATADGVSGGAIDVGDTEAHVTMTPTVSASLGNDAQVNAGGSVFVLATQDASAASANTINAASTAAVSTGLNRITLANHRLNTGDQIGYELAKFETPIGGLGDGRTYNILKVDNNQFKLGVLFDAAQIDAAANAIHFAAPHHLQTGDRVIYSRNTNTAVTGLTDLAIYFVRALDDRTIALTATSGGADLDIASGLGIHELTIDLTALGTSIHTFHGAGGAAALVDADLNVAPLSDGEAKAFATGASGSFVGVKGTFADATVTTNVAATVNQGADVTAGLDVTVATSTDARGDATADNLSISLVFGLGDAEANVDITDTNTASLGFNSSVTAGRDFTLDAHSEHHARGLAESGGGGLVEIARAFGTLSVLHDTNATVGSSADVVAGNAIRIEAGSDTFALLTLNADGDGLGVGSNTNDDRDETETNQRGVRIGRSSDRAFTQATVGSFATLHAKSVHLLANSANLEGTTQATTRAGGLITNAKAIARTEVYHTSQVNVNSSAQVYGADAVTLEADHDDNFTSTKADTRARDLFGVGVAAVTFNDQDNTSRVSVSSGSTITTHNLLVDAFNDGVGYVNEATKDGFGINLGPEAENGVHDPDRVIAFNADVVVLSGPAPELHVNEAGAIVRAVNVSATLPAGKVAVANITNSDPGTVRFQANTISATPSTIDGDSLITFRDTFETVTLINRSTRDFEINGIDPINRTTSSATVEVTISVQTNTYSFEAIHSFAPTVISISNLSTAAATDVLLRGLIENPVGTTTIVTPGDVFDGSGTALVRTNKLDIEATAGAVGTAAARLHAELVRSPGLLTDLDVTAGGDVHLDLKGRLRDPNIGIFTLAAGDVTAGEDINLLLREATREVGVVTLGYDIEVSEPLVPDTTNVTRFYPPGYAGAGTPTPPFPFGVFGSSPSTVAVTYDFGKLTAAQNLDVVISSTNTVVISADTDLLGSGRVNVATNGAVMLNEVAGDLRLGAISTSLGNIALSAQGSIVEATDDTASDITGPGITLNVQTGTIGTAANPLEIDSSSPVAGVISAVAAGDINLVEVANVLNVSAITSTQGSVTVRALTGSIFESGTDFGAEFSGVNVTLDAPQGSLGVTSNDLEVDSSFGTSVGAVRATAQAVFLSESFGPMNVQHAQASAGEVRLTAPDLTTTGQNVNLLANAVVSATGAVTLQAGDNLDTNATSSVSGTTVTLRVDHSSVDTSIGGAAILRGAMSASGGAAQLLGNVDADNMTLINWAGNLDVNGAAGTDGLTVSLSGGTVTTLELMTLNGNVVTNASAASAHINGSLTLGATAGIFNVADGAAATDLVVGATLGGARPLIKLGAGAMTLAANNTYSGLTMTSSGTLNVDGLQAGSPVEVNGGTLAGRGTVGAINATSGNVSPGGSGIATLTAAGNVVLSSATNFAVGLNGLLIDQHDRLSVVGTVNLNNAVLIPSLGFASAVGNVYTILANDGTDAVQGTFSGLAEGATLVINGITFRISYQGGDRNDVTLTHENTNSAFAQRSVTTPIDEMGTAVLTGRPVDPDPLDRFFLAVNWGDGSRVEEFEFAPQTPSVRLAHQYRDSGTYTIALQWFDQHGGGRSDSLTVVVNNVVPTFAINGPSSGVPGQKRTFQLRAGDVSPIDEAATFTYRITWGDGQTQTVTGPKNFTVEHTYATAGTFTVSATATDKDGGTSLAATTSLTIRGAEVQDGTLNVGGTNANDVIVIEPVDHDGNLRVVVNGSDRGTFRPTRQLVVYGQGGDDTVLLRSAQLQGRDATVDVPAVLDGGAGDDELVAQGSTANNVLLGQAGSDVLVGGRGRDLLIGGAGIDALYGDGDQDILIGGGTVHDDDLAALAAIQAEWGRNASRSQRQRRLTGAESGGLNGSYSLDADSLIDDQAIDVLFGEQGGDWVLTQAGDVVLGRRAWR